MTDLIKSDWKELDSDNTNPSPNGVQGGYAPSTIGPVIRSIRGALKRFYVQSNAAYATTGTGAAYVLTYSAAPQGYSAGIIYRFFAHADNTGAATININSLGAKAILSQHGEPLTAGKIKAGKVVEVVFNGTSFELISNEVHDSKFTGTTNIANIAVAGNASIANIAVAGNTSIATLSVGPGTNAVDGTILANLNTDRPWTIRQRGADGTATLSFENITGKSIEFSSETTYSGPKIVLNPTATPSITIGGDTVWHAGNDGAASGLDADLLDGQQGSYYLAASSYTASDILTKLKTVDGAASGLDADLLDGQQGSYYLAASSYTANDVLTKLLTVDGAGSGLDADTVDGIQGSSLVQTSRTVTAGNGLTGGGALSGNITITMGTPLNITNSTTNSLTTTGHAHALGFTAAEVYTGSVQDNLTFGIGHIIMIGQSSIDNVYRNQSAVPRVNASNLAYYSTAGTGGILTGTYRARGAGSGGAVAIFQRTA